jgi:endonuclease/exonuclease/phosphatase (EEP) superfamily protein YafD
MAQTTKLANALQHTRLLVWGAAIAILSRYAPETPVATVNWLVSLASAWGLHAGIFLLLWTLLDLASQSRRWARQGLLLLLGALGMLPYLQRDDAQPHELGALWRVAALNIHVDNENLQPALMWLKEKKTDIVVLAEAGELVKKALGDAAGDCLWNQRDDAFGMLVCSPHTLEGEWVTLDGWAVAWRGHAVTPNGKVEVWAVHPPPPLTPEMDAANRALWKKIEQASNNDEPTVVLGDFNATPGSASLRVLKSFQMASALLGTWGGPAGLALGHIASKRLCISEFEVSPTVGSDHRGVRALLRECP